MNTSPRNAFSFAISGGLNSVCALAKYLSGIGVAIFKHTSSGHTTTAKTIQDQPSRVCAEDRWIAQVFSKHADSENGGLRARYRTGLPYISNGPQANRVLWEFYTVTFSLPSFLRWQLYACCRICPSGYILRFLFDAREIIVAGYRIMLHIVRGRAANSE